MANNIFHKLAVVFVGMALSLTVMEAHPAKAEVITYDFNVDVTGGPLTGKTGSGSFAFDTSVLTTLPSFYTLTDFTFSFLDKTYGLDNILPRYRIEPLNVVGFSGDQLGFYDFVIPFSNCSDIGQCDPNIVITNGFFVYEPAPLSANQRSFGNVTSSRVSTSVPEPSPNLALGIGILGLGLLSKKKEASSAKRVE